MPHEAIDQMIAALDSEIKAVRKKGLSSSIEVFSGLYKGKDDNNFLYAFRVGSETYVRDDSPIKVVIGREEAKGMVVSLY